ncbi:transcription elongation factor A N-terminal and central domain-containing protein 2-like [Ruditapes philippinarum]|uniref:transcription elongation factor A N-terminal and central domain-containing protein 2-like n=1 Tax=Ruditapes philippinarum TaxID=129788 RepID=UPI00295B73F9|nr:transcription elongation factor A N-terminal and central domain-containing protein 2-like [Ruditapes philippinarum]
MDRFLIKNPTANDSRLQKEKASGSRMKQATITSLKGVVVVDDILHHKSRLQLATSSKEEKLHSLSELLKKIPPRHIMMSTKIGNVIKKLQNNEDEDIRKAAKKVYVKWRTHFVEHMERPMIEVKCDLKTEKLRASGTKLLTEALCVQASDKLPEAIERETFQLHKRLINNSYRRTIRHLVFMLKNQEDLRTKVKSGEITVTDFVKDNKKS